MRSRLLVLVALALAATACENKTLFLSALPAPANLAYQLEPSGDPNQPAGILLVWDDETDPALASFRIYSRGSTSSSWGLRGETTSFIGLKLNSFALCTSFFVVTYEAA